MRLSLLHLHFDYDLEPQRFTSYFIGVPTGLVTNFPCLSWSFSQKSTENLQADGACALAAIIQSSSKALLFHNCSLGNTGSSTSFWCTVWWKLLSETLIIVSSLCLFLYLKLHWDVCCPHWEKCVQVVKRSMCLTKRDSVYKWVFHVDTALWELWLWSKHCWICLLSLCA